LILKLLKVLGLRKVFRV